MYGRFLVEKKKILPSRVSGYDTYVVVFMEGRLPDHPRPWYGVWYHVSRLISLLIRQQRCEREHHVQNKKMHTCGREAHKQTQK